MFFHKFFAIAVLTLTLMSCVRKAPVKTPTALVPEVKYAVTSLESQHAATYKIFFADIYDEEASGHCSATAIGPHALLTAAHCVVNTNEITINDETKSTVVTDIEIDGQDHAIYTVNRTFVNYSPVVERVLVLKEPVHIWGNPKKLHDIYRDGYYWGSDSEVDLKNQKFILPVYPGDSGSAIFDATGNIVAVVSLSNGAEEVSLPLSFTPAQLKAASQKE